MKNKLLTIFKHFGYRSQVEKQKEEDAEFLEAVQEYIDNPCKETMDHMIEEYSDKTLVSLGIMLGVMEICGAGNEETLLFFKIKSQCV